MKKGLHFPSFTGSNKVAPLSKPRSTFKDKVMIVLTIFMLFEVSVKNAFSQQVGTEVAGESIEQAKQGFINRMTQSFIDEINMNGGHVNIMDEEMKLDELAELEGLDTVNFIKKMVFSQNPSDDIIIAFSKTAPESSKELANLNNKLQLSYGFEKLSSDFQYGLNIDLYDKRSAGFKKIKKWLSK